MADVNYEDLLPEILPMVAGCSDTLILNNIRSAAIEFCEKSGVYQEELDPITTVDGLYQYDLEAPSGARIHKILWVTFEGGDLEPISTTLLEQRLPKWRTSNQKGKPIYYVKDSLTTISLVPIPSATVPSSTNVRAILKPTHTSTACSDQVMSEYRDAIVNGALFRLLRIPSKDWTDFSGAQVYGTLFTEQIRYAEMCARNADTGIARKVNYGGLYTRSGLRRNRYGNERKS